VSAVNEEEFRAGVPEWEWANLDPDPDAPPMSEQIAAINAEYPIPVEEVPSYLDHLTHPAWCKCSRICGGDQ
jgi:hypothetical protein